MPHASTLTYEQVSMVIDYDPETGALTWKRRPIELFKTTQSCGVWNRRYSGKPALNNLTNKGYRQGRVLGVMAKSHRVAWLLTYKKWPTEFIDHINRDPSDNRIINLREATVGQSVVNRVIKKKSKTGVTNVFMIGGGKYRVSFSINRVSKTFGVFDTLEEAAEAAKEARKKVRGEFAFDAIHPVHEVAALQSSAQS